ncbi:MAG: tRNA uridine-5-carboxymethylaminomethyl(34) synthesis GTPase MnmE [Flavobacteriales bacterium]|nr:tRNA uridine-5-carboxymethylaminomethyl(34) synthesis GTPase MnmE [Flavobacteriales bacterium]
MIQDTICALATASGVGAISVIRLSGPEAISICDKVFSTKDLSEQLSHTVHFGTIRNADKIVDEVLVTVFKAPYSYTGENVVEVSCHGSIYIQNQLIQLFLKKGARMAKPGEYTLRAFSNGKMDLSQAEAVADLIASDSEAAHKVAIQQMRGGFSSELKDLREELINFAALIELELDFSEEDVEFADRDKFNKLLEKIKTTLKRLVDSFAVGNVIKNGIPVAIIGEPNVGKSTLLNALLNEERAIVSDVAGTTRDTIEDDLIIKGIHFRFIDTAGLRETNDKVESIGIQKALDKAQKAQVVLYLMDATKNLSQQLLETEELKLKLANKLVLVVNKIDQNPAIKEQVKDALFISAKQKKGLEALTETLISFVNTGALSNNQTIVSNSRHVDALNKSLKQIIKTIDGLNSGVSGDFLAMDIRQALYHLGEITGEISTDDLLDNIFSNFCIGK